MSGVLPRTAEQTLINAITDHMLAVHSTATDNPTPVLSVEAAAAMAKHVAGITAAISSYKPGLVSTELSDFTNSLVATLSYIAARHKNMPATFPIGITALLATNLTTLMLALKKEPTLAQSVQPSVMETIGAQLKNIHDRVGSAMRSTNSQSSGNMSEIVEMANALGSIAPDISDEIKTVFKDVCTAMKMDAELGDKPDDGLNKQQEIAAEAAKNDEADIQIEQGIAERDALAAEAARAAEQAALAAEDRPNAPRMG